MKIERFEDIEAWRLGRVNCEPRTVNGYRFIHEVRGAIFNAGYTTLTETGNVCMNNREWFKSAKFGMMVHWGLYTQCFHDKIKPQVEELLRNYGELCLVWFDTPLTVSPEQSAELFRTVKKRQPDCLVNTRIGNGLGDYRSMGDNEISDEFMGEALVETPATLNDTWGYKSFDQNWKSAQETLRLKNHLNERGVNYLLNVGPDYLGRIPAPCADVLAEVGAATDARRSPGPAPDSGNVMVERDAPSTIRSSVSKS